MKLSDAAKPLKLSCRDFAKEIGVETETISLLITEKIPITRDLAIRFSHYFNTSTGLWLNLQQGYDNYGL